MFLWQQYLCKIGKWLHRKKLNSNYEYSISYFKIELVKEFIVEIGFSFDLIYDAEIVKSGKDKNLVS